ncbi:MAG: leucyl/phenylalanyl-tRNA--protein transferase [Myxococcota bacterium]|jgi:leucyl/phenylalanyl-tRNA--protein transferase
MELHRCIEEWPFPDPRRADADGLLALGGDLRPERLLSAYARGIFPWYESDPILWFSPDPRMVLVPRDLYVSRSLQKTMSQGRYSVRMDTAFDRVIRACAEIPRPGQDGTWITPEMIEAYVELHRLGYAHSSEAWQEGELVGGAYGISLGSAFFGESMFAAESDASKVAFVSLVEQLDAWGMSIIDCQVPTAFLASFGGIEWPRDHFLDVLDTALETPTRAGPWSFADVP